MTPTPAALIATVAVATMTTAACSHDVDRESSNRGAGTETTLTTVDNAFIVPHFIPGSCAIQVGDDADLSFTVTNNRPADTEHLHAVTTDAADAVRVTPSAIAIPPKSTIAAGQPADRLDEPTASGAHVDAVVDGLTPRATPGTSITMTFDFAKAGKVALRVPIEACPTQK